jgi:hypothetical protein
MDMDDDFMGEVEFQLSPEQGDVVARAIELATKRDDEFGVTNPLIVIMQWWESQVPEREKLKGSPEATLAEACKRYLAANEPR